MLEALFGADMPLALRFFLAFLIVLGLIGATAWAVRRFGAAFAARRRATRQDLIDRGPGRSGRGLARAWEEGFPSAAGEIPTGLLRRSRGLVEGNQVGCE